MTPKRVRSLPTVVWFTIDPMNFCMLLNLLRSSMATWLSKSFRASKFLSAYVLSGEPLISRSWVVLASTTPMA
ncbi:hypothetical protein EYF80_038036 [Liparis tanakae]|uniref:Uncharacterized protein n=1 Tax=Liparis tanakae TaxID=230148 RepID=A0A4Z2GEZ1_9TELE|nr:hypothetical protein EYF80_038036 [Liparis tanakae]